MNDAKEELDRTLRAALAKWTRGLSPASLMLAWADWFIHFASMPTRSNWAVWVRPWMIARQSADSDPGAPSPAASRERGASLADPSWNQWPFCVARQNFRGADQWLRELTEDVPGVDRHHGQVVSFTARQLHGIASPANSLATNPVVLQKTLETAGMNLVQGMQNWAGDLQRRLRGLPPEGAEAFLPGQQVACTPGKVVLRNPLMELIQYAPTTPTVHPEPVLVMSAWIMKYYILDLSPHNSLIRYLVDSGHTVFAISWKNPDAADRDLGIEDYLAHGLMDGIDAIRAIVPSQRIHALGYCLGGTLLAIGAAAMARDRDDRLASVTLLAAQTDFTEPGELSLFIDQSQLTFLEDVMARQGYLDASQMAGAFALLRADDLIWSPMVQRYLLGERAPMTDLMAWNADGTRMPYRMHADYLRSLFLDNDLAEGRFQVKGRPVSLGDIKVPIFAVGTRTDHVAPWRSVYKLHLLCAAEITFVLTEGGHNAGIVSEPGHPRRSHRILRRPAGAPFVPPDAYEAQAGQVDGSWWPALASWLAAHSGPRRKPPPMGSPRRGLAPLGDAPGHYVMSR